MRKATVDALASFMAEMEQASSVNGKGETVAELQERLGLGMIRVRAILRAAQKAGRLTVGQRPAVNLCGRSILQTVYTVSGRISSTARTNNK